MEKNIKNFSFTYKKINANLFHSLLFSFLILVLISYSNKNEVNPILSDKNLKDFSSNWSLEVDRQKEIVNLPLENINIETRTITLEKKLPVINFSNNYLFFRATQAYVSIYIEDDLVYEYKPKKNFFRKIPGSTWVLLALDESYSDKRITIIRETKYDKFYNSMNRIYLGTKADIISFLLKNSYKGLISSFFMLITGIICVLVSLTIKKKLNSRKIYYLGIFSVLCSIWSLGELRILQLILGNVNFVSHLAFLSLNMGHLAFLMFIYSFDFYSRDRIFKNVILFSFGTFILINILHITGIMDYFESLVITHIAIITSVMYICFKYSIFFFRKNIGEHIKTLHFHMLIFFLIALSDLVKFYVLKTAQLGGGISLGLCYFISTMAILSFKQLSKAFSEKLELSLLKKIAYTDSLTKLYNRSAFEEKRKELELKEELGEISLISVDINNLKFINDNFGHQEGDKALEEVSKLMYSKFNDYGTIYRIGGDEFVIVGNHNITKELSKIFKEINEEIRANLTFGRIKPYIAYGHVLFRNGANFDKKLKEADNQMYLCKERMKNMEKLNYIFNN